MNAQEAFQITEKNWSENEKTLLPLVINYHGKVEQAASEGRCQCVLGTVPILALDFVSCYFEEMGYFVFPQQVSATDMVITINWKNVPNMSRSFLKSVRDRVEIDQFLETV